MARPSGRAGFQFFLYHLHHCGKQLVGTVFCSVLAGEMILWRLIGFVLSNRKFFFRSFILYISFFVSFSLSVYSVGYYKTFC
jgi:hypothetical protein